MRVKSISRQKIKGGNNAARKLRFPAVFIPLYPSISRYIPLPKKNIKPSFVLQGAKIKKAAGYCPAALYGERAGTRTRGHLIKSQVLYQLSYTPVHRERNHIRMNKKGQDFFYIFFKIHDIVIKKTKIKNFLSKMLRRNRPCAKVKS